MRIKILLMSISFILIFPLFIKSQNISGIINLSQNVTKYDFCRNSVTVPSSTGFSIGDKLLLIQMKGAVIDTTNTINSGTILSYGNAGNYEFAIIKSIAGNEIFLRDSVMRNYDDSGNVQIVKVPIYSNVTVTDTLRCMPWNGLHGGILVFEVTGTLTLNAPIDVSNRGFFGGAKFYCDGQCISTAPDYVRPSITPFPKGEGIAKVPYTVAGGLGTLANGGGGSGALYGPGGITDAYYLGGGGGGNFGGGGRGGKSSSYCSTSPWEGGLGGKSLTFSPVLNKIFMAGGGGVGHHKFNSTGNEYGTNGGGMMILKANTVICNNQTIIANALDVPFISGIIGRSGGGAGGTIALEVQSYSGSLNINVKGGKGGNSSGTNKFGPGGGGSGGTVWVSQPTIPSNFSITLDGGMNGIHTTSGDSWGATPGQQGGTQTGLSLLQTSNALFVPVTQTANIISNSPLCVGDTLHLTTGPVPPTVQYSWTGPNGFTSNLQNPSINNLVVADSGAYNLEIIVQGCPGPTNTAHIFVGTYPLSPSTSNDTICTGNPNPALIAVGNHIHWYSDSTLLNLVSSDSIFIPTVTTAGSYTFYVTQSDSVCQSDFSLAVLEILPSPPAPVVNNQTICFGNPINPFIASGNGIIKWYSDSLLTNLIYTGSSYSPSVTIPGIYNYYVTAYDTVYLCTSYIKNVTLTIIPLPSAIACNDTSICKGDTAHLFVNVNSSSTFIWSTGETSQQIYVNPALLQTQYSVTVNNGCGTASDSVKVFINPPPPLSTNDTVCSGNSNPGLIAQGNNIHWYSDSTLINLLSTNSTYIPTVTSIGTHIFYATQSDSICESYATPVILEILPTPAPPVVNNQTICIGDSIYPFIAVGNGIINWYSDSLLSNLIQSGDTLISNETNPGIYHYYVTLFDTVYLCTSLKKEVTLMIIPLPYAIACNDTSICKGDTASLAVDASINSTFLWSNGGTTQQINISPTAQTQFYVTVNNGCFGYAVDSVMVSVFSLPPANAGFDTSICLGGSATLTASGGILYQWSHNLGNTNIVSASPTTNTNYIVTVTDANTCSKTDDVNVSVLALPNIQINGDTLICEGNATLLTATGGTQYLWDNGSTTASISASPVNNQIYYVTVTNTNNCKDSSNFEVKVHNSFYINLSSDFTPENSITQGQVITFTATPNIYSLFDFYIDNQLKQSGGSNVFSTASINNGNYVSVIAYELGCPSVEDSILVKVKVLPNAFTPFEKDGVNEIFGKGLELTIINKWGQEIYKGIDGWNGEYKNEHVSPGTYYYIIELNNGTPNAQILTGSVNVVLK